MAFWISSGLFRRLGMVQELFLLSAPSDHTRKYYKLLGQTLLYGQQAKFKDGTTSGATWHHHLYRVVPCVMLLL